MNNAIKKLIAENSFEQNSFIKAFKPHNYYEDCIKNLIIEKEAMFFYPQNEDGGYKNYNELNIEEKEIVFNNYFSNESESFKIENHNDYQYMLEYEMKKRNIECIAFYEPELAWMFSVNYYNYKDISRNKHIITELLGFENHHNLSVGDLMNFIEYYYVEYEYQSVGGIYTKQENIYNATKLVLNGKSYNLPNENDNINRLVYHKNYTSLLKEYITELIGKYYLTEDFYKSLL